MLTPQKKPLKPKQSAKCFACTSDLSLKVDKKSLKAKPKPSKQKQYLTTRRLRDTWNKTLNAFPHLILANSLMVQNVLTCFKVFITWNAPLLVARLLANGPTGKGRMGAGSRVVEVPRCSWIQRKEQWPCFYQDVFSDNKGCTNHKIP